MAAFTVQQGKRYRAEISLGFFERMKGRRRVWLLHFWIANGSPVEGAPDHWHLSEA